MSGLLKKYAIIFTSLFCLTSCNPEAYAPMIMQNAAPYLLKGLYNEASITAPQRQTQRRQNNPAQCVNNLMTTGVSFLVVPNDTKGNCTVPQMVVLDRGLYPYTGTGNVRGTCPLMSAVHVWEKTVVQPAAARHLRSPIDKIWEMGTYSCRNIAGTNKRSEHSKGNAIDIGGFHLKNGQKITILKDWGKNTPEGRFLRDVYQGSCRVFNGVLSPNYNAAHRDHLHLDVGEWRTCD